MDTEIAKHSYLTTWLIALSCIFFIIYTWVFIQFSVDDAYITFRYASNLVAKGVWNWNAVSYGLVESYTNPIYAVLAVVPETLGLNTVLFFKAFSLCVLGVLIFRLSRERNCKFVIFFLSTYAISYVHLYAGLETFLFVVTCLVAWLEMRHLSSSRASVFWICVFLLPFIRPEGALFAISGLVYGIIKRPGDRAIVAFIFFIWIVYFLTRLFYFGELLPNTFYVKSTHSRDAGEVLANFRSMQFYFLFIGCFFWISRDRLLRTYIALVFFLLTFYCFSDLQMNYADRFAFQVVLPLIVIALLDLDRVGATKSLVVFLLILMLSVISLKRAYVVVASQYSHSLVQLHVLGESLRKYRGTGRLLISDAGILPYKSGWETLDYIGLGNRDVAHAGYLSTSQIESFEPHLMLISANGAGSWINLSRESRNAIEAYIANSKVVNVGTIKWSESYVYDVFINEEFEYAEEVLVAVREAIHFSNENNLEEGLQLLDSVINFRFFDDEMRANK